MYKMAAPTKPTQTQELKKKKKKWIPVFASKEFNNQEIGETYLEESEQAMNRVVESNLMMLTREAKKQNFNVYFKITEVKNNQASTELVGYKMQVSQLKRLTRQGKNKVDDSFVYTTKDNVKAVIKPIFLTKALTYKTTLHLIRRLAREFLTNYVKTMTYSQLMREIIAGNLQKDVKLGIKKGYPVINCIIKEASRID